MKLNYVKSVTPGYTGDGALFKWNDFYNDYIYSRPMPKSMLDAFISNIMSRSSTVDQSLPPLETFPSTLGPEWFAGFAAYISGTGSVVPEESYSIGPLKEGVSNKDFFKRQREGEIIMSPYKLSKVDFVLKNGRSVTPIRYLGRNAFGPSGAQILSPFPTIKGKDGNMWCTVPGSDEVCNPALMLEREIGEVDFSVKPSDIGLTKEKLNSLFSTTPSNPADPAWIQSVVAEANTRALDWLTTLSELPETIKYLFTIVRNLGSILKKWKSREATIRETFRKMALDLQKQISDTLNLISKAKGKTMIRNLRRKLRTLNRRYSRLGKDLISALSSAWMQYRYAIMPLIYTAEDAAEALRNMKFQYFVTRDKSAIPLAQPSLGDAWKFEGTSTTNCRVTLKYSYAPFSDFMSLSRVLSANLATTAWELTSKSFVWDWFFTVGDFLASGFGKPEAATQCVMSVSYEHKIVGTYVHDSTGCEAKVDSLHYAREIPDPRSFSGIYFRKNLNWKRYVDAFAMAWPTLRKSVK